MLFTVGLWAAICVSPALRVINSPLSIPSRKQPIQIFGVLEILADDEGSVCVVHDVLTELFAIVQNVVDQSAEKHEIRSRAQGCPDIRDCGSTAEPRIDVNQLRPV